MNWEANLLYKVPLSFYCALNQFLIIGVCCENIWYVFPSLAVRILRTRMPVQSFFLSDMFDHLWWRPDTVKPCKLGSLLWRELCEIAVRSYDGDLRNSAQELNFSSGPCPWSFSEHRFAHVWLCACLCIMLTWSCLTSDLPYHIELIQWSLNYWLILVTVSRFFLLLGTVGLSVLSVKLLLHLLSSQLSSSCRAAHFFCSLIMSCNNTLPSPRSCHLSK